MKQHSTAQLIYGKSQSTILSGVAILLMLFHHFFGFPDYLKDGITCMPIISTSIMLNLASFSKMCVAIYAFNTGYAMWANRDKYTYSKIPARIMKFLLQYWIICALFILYALITNDNLPTLNQLVQNLFGFKTGPSDFVNFRFAWYVHFYIVILAISPIAIKLFQYNRLIINCVIAVILICCVAGLLLINHYTINSYLVVALSSSMYSYLSSVLMGIIVCKFNILQTIDNLIKPRNIVFYIGVIMLVVVVRKYLRIGFLEFNQDAIWVVIFIYSILGIIRNVKLQWIKNSLTLLGKYSMNMWFLHGLFFTGTLNILQKILYFPQYTILVFIWGVILVLPTAIICSYIQNKIINLIWRKS